jgi:hypothetical protein
MNKVFYLILFFNAFLIINDVYIHNYQDINIENISNKISHVHSNEQPHNHFYTIIPPLKTSMFFLNNNVIIILKLVLNPQQFDLSKWQPPKFVK